ncbi:uncharacterized protein Dana_GF22026 [Drosophila ananassae]|uniref:Uncharacterized protein n=1 Tax=Drosophila ananassae TaxID=7217 RepID=B3MYI1_DROAN|nr:uncharacterized protein LOC6504695 [Drosophila ananassae]EDV32675.2 uncharacterized protein Dana_GF22026 [Drosophila ananassae]
MVVGNNIVEPAALKATSESGSEVAIHNNNPRDTADPTDTPETSKDPEQTTSIRIKLEETEEEDPVEIEIEIENLQNNNMTDAGKESGEDAALKLSTTNTSASSPVSPNSGSSSQGQGPGPGPVGMAIVPTKSAVSQRNVDIKIEKTSNMEAATQQLTKKVLKLDLGGKNLDDFSLKSPKSPIAARLPHQTSLTSSVDVEDRKTLREALYQGIFHRHRRTIFAVGSFLRMLRSRNSQYNTIRSSSEGEDIDEFLKRRGSKLLRLQHLFER